jgi:homoserine O-acetyltransferase
MMVSAGLAVSALAQGPSNGSAPIASVEGDFIAHDFHFSNGETIADLRLHYTTLGQPRRDAAGHVTNAVMVLHGTRSNGAAFLRPSFGGVLFAPGGVLDPAKYFIILPDGIGHGKSSKPSDGMHDHFPKYGYQDMVQAQYRLLTEGLKIDHLRLILGTSMGCMQSFMWGESHVEFVDGLMPLACLPVPIVGRNRLWRQMIIDAIHADPAWQQGEYASQPMAGLRTAADLWAMAASAPLQMQKTMPNAVAADQYKDVIYQREFAAIDANDLIYQLDASRDYDPEARLDQIKAQVIWVNSGDDFINPPELGLAEREVGRLKHGRFILLPASDKTQGHGSYNFAELWQKELADLLSATAPR